MVAAPAGGARRAAEGAIPTKAGAGAVTTPPPVGPQAKESSASGLSTSMPNAGGSVQTPDISAWVLISFPQN